MKRRCIQRESPEYPDLLNEIGDPPKKLFLAGKRLEPAPAVAVVGTRQPSKYGVEAARWVAAELAQSGVTIVSGMAKGIDAAAHWGALDAGGPTVAILGCGLDVCYPRQNRRLYETILERGTLVSEYEPGSPALPHNFPRRNRIIAGISLAVVLVEGRRKGGALITARLSMEYGRDVLAIPGPIHSPGSWGSHALVRQGARLVTSADDVLEDLGMLRAPEAQRNVPELDPDERRVLSCIEAEPTVLDLIARRSRMPSSSATSVLVRLELKGLVSRHPGGRFALPVG